MRWPKSWGPKPKKRRRRGDRRAENARLKTTLAERKAINQDKQCAATGCLLKRDAFYRYCPTHAYRWRTYRDLRETARTLLRKEIDEMARQVYWWLRKRKRRKAIKALTAEIEEWWDRWLAQRNNPRVIGGKHVVKRWHWLKTARGNIDVPIKWNGLKTFSMYIACILYSRLNPDRLEFGLPLWLQVGRQLVLLGTELKHRAAYRGTANYQPRHRREWLEVGRTVARKLTRPALDIIEQLDADPNAMNTKPKRKLKTNKE